MEWICWLFPACVAKTIVYKRSKAGKEELNSVKEICSWGCWVLGINILTMIIIMYCLGIGNVLLDAFSSLSFALKYLVIATVMAVILPYIIEILGKYISVSVEIDKAD